MVEVMAPDKRGGLRCPACRATADVEAFEERAGTSRARERRGRLLIGLALGALTVAGVAAFAISTSRDRERSAAVKEANDRARARFAPAAIALGSFKEHGTSVCDDALLEPRAAPMGEPWALGTVSDASVFRWEMGLRSARVLRPASVAESRSAIELVDRAQLVIVLIAHVDTFSHWQGELVVVDLQAGKARCWAPMEVDGERGHFVIDATKLRESAAEALATITKVVGVVE